MVDDTLGPLEQRVMQSLWDRGAQTPRQVLERLNADSPRALAYTTVMTILVRLSRKGYVERRLAGRTYRYSPLVDRANVADVAGRRGLDELLHRHGPDNVARFALDLGPPGDDLVERLKVLARDAKHDSTSDR